MIGCGALAVRGALELMLETTDDACRRRNKVLPSRATYLRHWLYVTMSRVSLPNHTSCPSPTEHSLSYQFSLLIMTGNQSLLVLELPITISSDTPVKQSYIYRPQQTKRTSFAQLRESLPKPADWRRNKGQFWLNSLDGFHLIDMERTPSHRYSEVSDYSALSIESSNDLPNMRRTTASAHIS